MKKIREKTLILLKILMLSAAVWFCISETETVKTAVSGALLRCINIIIPSLYAMMAVSSLVIKSGITSRLPMPFKSVGRLLFGMDGDSLPIFIFSMFAGYPAGAKMLCTGYDSGYISKKSAGLLMGICFGAGPAFIFGCISGQLYSSPLAGKIILISTVSANFILAFLISFLLRKNSGNEHSVRRKITVTGDILTECIISGGKTIAEICFMITAFSVLTAMLDTYGILHHAAKIFSGISGFSLDTSAKLLPAFLDITAVNDLPENNYSLLPYLCALTSFGGVCVIFQISAVVSGRLPLKPLILLRSAAALLSFIICRIIMPFMMRDEVVSASSITVKTYKAPSPVPSLMIILMTFMLMCEYGSILKCNKKNKNI
jgi:hypothetical protein rflaF_16316